MKAERSPEWTAGVPLEIQRALERVDPVDRAFEAYQKIEMQHILEMPEGKDRDARDRILSRDFKTWSDRSALDGKRRDGSAGLTIDEMVTGVNAYVDRVLAVIARSFERRLRALRASKGTPRTRRKPGKVIDITARLTAKRDGDEAS